MHKIWWLWLPVIFIGLQLVLEFVLPWKVLAAMHSENGPHELMQFLILVAAFSIAVRTLFLIGFSSRKPLFFWVLIAALSCFYVAGEEVSWGQHFMSWATPEFWQTINDQQETNLHNTSSWLDQKPRLLLEIGVIVGGLLIPWLRAKKSSMVPERFDIIYPPAWLGVTALIALMIKLVDKIGETIEINIFERASEVQELYLFYFVLLYLVQLMSRVKNKN